MKAPSYDAIIDLLKSQENDKLAHITLDKNDEIKLARYVHLDYQYSFFKPVIKKIQGPCDHNDKIYLKSLKESEGLVEDEKGYLEKIKNQESTSYLKGVAPEIDISTIPLVRNEKGNLKLDQPEFIYSPEIKIEECHNCQGNKYLSCTNPYCNGAHIYTCHDCKGKKTAPCQNCRQEGKTECETCYGRAKVRCHYCEGKGKILSEGQTVNCTVCYGKGKEKCNDCEKGIATCSVCKGKKESMCTTCLGRGQLTCEECYSDGKRRGRVDCPVCEASGSIVTLWFAENYNDYQSIKGVYCLDDEFWEVESSDLTQWANKEYSYQKVNESFPNLGSNEKDLYENVIPLVKEQLNINQSSKNQTEELISFRIYNCAQVTYHHIINKMVGRFVILDYGDKNIVKFVKDPSKVRISKVKDEKKSILQNFASRIFQFRKKASNTDKKSELILYIYLMKADGIIEETEKNFLTKKIHDTIGFDTEDKKYFYQLINSKVLPGLNKEQIVFSSKEKSLEVIENLKALSSADGDLNEKEVSLIHEIEKLVL